MTHLIYTYKYTFLFNERNSNSNRRFRFASNLNGVRFYANITNLPHPTTLTRQSFYILFNGCEIFDRTDFHNQLLKYLNPDTWYFIIACINYLDNDNTYKCLETKHHVYPSEAFNPEGKARIDVLHAWLIPKEGYNFDNDMINCVSIYFSVIDNKICDDRPSDN